MDYLVIQGVLMKRFEHLRAAQKERKKEITLLSLYLLLLNF
ncbi:hypothetical protein RCH33_2956 [Flavobacterium daejeonense]|nr:hypothetical protein RCH33_2956 [Flavobacterium daejeonense]